MANVRRNSVKATILVVDDSPEIQRYLRALLELDSYRVETASNGYEALQSLADVCPMWCCLICRCREWMAWKLYAS